MRLCIGYAYQMRITDTLTQKLVKQSLQHSHGTFYHCISSYGHNTDIKQGLSLQILERRLQNNSLQMLQSYLLHIHVTLRALDDNHNDESFLRNG